MAALNKNISISTVQMSVVSWMLHHQKGEDRMKKSKRTKIINETCKQGRNDGRSKIWQYFHPLDVEYCPGKERVVVKDYLHYLIVLILQFQTENTCFWEISILASKVVNHDICEEFMERIGNRICFENFSKQLFQKIRNWWPEKNKNIKQ